MEEISYKDGIELKEIRVDGSSVVDPDPEGAETFSRIRIRAGPDPK